MTRDDFLVDSLEADQDQLLRGVSRINHESLSLIEVVEKLVTIGPRFASKVLTIMERPKSWLNLGFVHARCGRVPHGPSKYLP